ncbi:MAG: hypothetical protein FD167_333 [bacterium]|nr:MAG: hypothetical protein FD167_333 [bacterium]
MKIKALKLFALVLIVGYIGMFGLTDHSSAKYSNINTGQGDLTTFEASYQKWLENTSRNGTDQYLTMSFGWMKGLSTEYTNANGKMRVELKTGKISVKASNLPDAKWDIWLIENRPGPTNSTLPDQDDRKINIGTFESIGKIAKFDTRLDPTTLANFSIDRVAIVRAGNDPADFVLTGAPTLFQRMQLNRVAPVRLDELEESSSVDTSDTSGIFGALFASFSTQAQSSDPEALIAKGRKIFLTETFKGNGRNCATCHRENNNFTIDPKFIATLPPNDPLFVAETNPALSKNFEKPELLRKFGLILENPDGMDDLDKKFVLRSSSHLLSLSTTITSPDPKLGIDFTTNGLNPDPVERLGWGGDGSPGSGSLREFAIGAITQHFPKTLGRKPGTDFRLPTDAELDALEAFQLSIGRQEDIDLNKLVIKDPLANSGKTMYFDTGGFAEKGHKNCNACHIDAGGTTGIGDFANLLDALPLGFNTNQSTAVNRLPQVAQNGLPPDGAFGRILLPDGAFGNIADVPGVGPVPVQEFNTTPLIEAADTGPFFHNHMVETLEDSVAFYGTDAFQMGIDSVGNVDLGGFVPVKISKDPKDKEVLAISALLRVLNVLENIRSSVSIETRAQQKGSKILKELIPLAISENQDAIDVLSNGALVTQLGGGPGVALANVIAADSLLKVASSLPKSQAAQAKLLIGQALERQRAARMALVDPATLPKSFQN